MAQRQFHLMTKPIGPICNLDCEYCYYLEKENLYPEKHSWRMTPEVQEEYIKQYIDSQESSTVQFAWQGGEPTLLGVAFFKRAVELQQKYANGNKIENALQTNGTLLDDEWGEFFAKNSFLIGLSIDGPEHLHDAYRKDKQGRGSHEKVVQGLEFLKKHGAEFNTLTVVHSLNSQEPLEVYKYLKSIGSTFFQFIPLVERNAPPNGLLKLADPEQRHITEVTDWSVGSVAFGDFLIKIFDTWVRNDVAKIFVQQFDIALASWTGVEPPLCVFRKTCGEALVMEHNGDVYSCDHYVYPQHKLGNIERTPLREMAWSARQKAFGQDKQTTLTDYCRKCPSLFACNGDCPKHRFIKSPEGEPGLSYLCAGYRKFFAHIDDQMKKMVELLRQERAPAEIMSMLQEDDLTLAANVIGRNAPCPCGSGKKYNQCCLRSV